MTTTDGIRSDLGIAESQARALGEVSSLLESPTALSLDLNTTLAGNTEAQKAIQAAIDSAQQISQALTRAKQNIQTVAENFQAADQAGGR